MLDVLFRDRNAARDADVYALTILTAIRVGSEASLAAYVRGISRESSPFRLLPATHFARLVVVDELAELPEVRTQHLLFSAVIDGTTKYDRDAYLREMCRCIPREVDEIWGRCLAVASSADPVRFAATMAAHQLETRAFYTHYAASVGEVRRALEVHGRVRRVAGCVQYLRADELRRRVEPRLERWRR